MEYQIFDAKGKQPIETIQEEFVLSGFYPVDPLMGARMVLTSEEYAEGLNLPKDNISLNVQFSNSLNIEKRLYTIIVGSGYSIFPQDSAYIDVGVNWAYMSEEFKNADPTVVVGGIVILLIIILTGYLIIYNIFQISVLKDIRFYGLLKTIGTTSKQLRRIIGRQALILSAIGIPLGLTVGYVVGNLLLPIIVQQLNMDNSIKITLILHLWNIINLVSVVKMTAFQRML
ncbi:FtsX-like permease family protein [Alkaliphilus hydrothermalis]|uniref:ABC-type antimicrobial peptide transport system permease subunit n=1 Tax=Alkaliphilus hydrothermalis TaxID=1482730 RepID=A0ABS2NSX0_9FIRM|nr:ABC transporter permease [Alkaliphilus hydrothermalis]MBM7615669.1 ABC-type antimicrobial peptide transport system permease subunit [Alkaliphilus hydrothermalis]